MPDIRRLPKSGLYGATLAESSDVGEGSTNQIRAPRTSAGTSRFASGHRVPSALRRLPPGARSALPSSSYPLNDGSDEAGSRQPSSSSSSLMASSGGSKIPNVSALARTNQKGPRGSLGASLSAAANGGVVQHDREGREVVKLNVDSTSFEEWMKMATDNKINATNTWNFALIDYFHDMSLLRSDTGDGSINFQKASCTLDGCVKVWTSRVDSVVVETGKLLSGLQDESKDNTKGRRRHGDEADEDGEGVEDDNGGSTRKKRNRAKEPTLAKSFAQLAAKKLDLEFTVDPLFKKTSADFDEGGAGGLLMNHLGVDSQARVVFDAGDVPGQDDIDDRGNAKNEDISDVTETALTQDEDGVDLTKIRYKLFGQHDVSGEEDALSSLLGPMTVCPTFTGFRFSPDDNTPFSALTAQHDADHEYHTGLVTPVQEWDDVFTDPPQDDDGFEDAFGEQVPSYGLLGNQYGDALQFDDGANYDIGTGGEEMGATERPNLDFATSLQGISNDEEDGAGSSVFFDYFDQRLTKNWAGPEHWKMRNVGLGTLQAQSSKNAGNDRPRKVKEPFVIDFKTPQGVIPSKELFEAGRGNTGTLLPAGKDSEELYLLPEDRHFSSRQLLRLFTKPRAIIQVQRRMQMHQGADSGNPQSWLQTQEQGHDDDVFTGMNALGFDTGGEAEEPFDAQFFHEDEADFGMGGGGDDALALEPEDEEELATQALKRIRPEYVNYAKKAKRVDIRKLKENIWQELAIKADDDEGDDDNLEEDQQDDSNSSLRTDQEESIKRDPTEPRTFELVLAGLRKLYPKDKMEEISTSFCFICLLHLANEEGLQIKMPADATGLDMLAGKSIVEDDEDDALDGDVPRSRQSTFQAKPLQDRPDDDLDSAGLVGYLDQLNIAKDPGAGRSA